MFTKSASKEIIYSVPRVRVLLPQISIFNVTKYWRLWPEFLKFYRPDPKSWISTIYIKNLMYIIWRLITK